MKYTIALLVALTLSGVFTACGNGQGVSGNGAPVCDSGVVETGVRICSVDSGGSGTGAIVLYNFTSSAVSIADWTLEDADAHGAGSGGYTFASGETIASSTYRRVDTLPFDITAGEMIYLKDDTGTIRDQRAQSR